MRSRQMRGLTNRNLKNNDIIPSLRGRKINYVHVTLPVIKEYILSTREKKIFLSVTIATIYFHDVRDH